MAETFLLEILTPQGQLLSQEVDEMTAPGLEGEFGVLSGHAPYLTILKAGELIYTSGGKKGYIAVRKGYAEVGPEKVTILADVAEGLEDMDRGRIESELKEAEERLSELDEDSPEYRETTELCDFLRIKLEMIGKYR